MPRLALAFFLSLIGQSIDVAAAPPRQASGKVNVRWVGQDGQDFVGPNNRMEPSDVQDIHLVLEGLDPQHKVVFIDLAGEGGDQWHYNEQSFAWKAEFKRAEGGTSGDLYVEPGRLETGRAFKILVRYDNGRTLEARFPGSVASPRVRMPNARLAASWVGQDGSDWTSTGPSVGPDGFQDVRIKLSGISTKVKVRTLRIDDTTGTRWEVGVNPEAFNNAELIVDPKNPGEGSLYLQPVRSLEGTKIRLIVIYENETVDGFILTGEACDPRLETPIASLPRFHEAPLSLSWIGQEEATPAGRGAVHLRLGGLKGLGKIVGAVLTDSVQGTWVYRTDHELGKTFLADEYPEPLFLEPAKDGEADLYFPPTRDETGAELTFRLILDDAGMALARVSGGSCDPALRSEAPESTRAEAKPGDDLQALASRGGMLMLGAGIYRLTRPLVLDTPVTITSRGGVTLLFSQPAESPPWTAAIKVHRGRTTLDNLRIRFEGPVRWNNDVSYGAAVIGTTDALDTGFSEAKFGLRFTRLDLENSAVTDPKGWVDAIRLMSLRNAKGGMIIGNTLCGGPIEFFEGPWRIEKNRSRGTPAGTFSPCVFGAHFTHDLVLKGNWAEPTGNGTAGKVWRFLVLTNRGANDLVAENTIRRLGPRDDDTIPWANAPEMFLTEAYQLTYEGKLMGLSRDGRVARIGQPQGSPARTGGVVAILSGPAAGTSRRITQVLDPTTYLVDEPIPAETEHVSIGNGFVGETFEGNVVDTRGGKSSVPFALFGNHHGTKLIRNHVMGPEEAFRLTSYATETPMMWGWSHVPVFGVTIADNIIEDSLKGGTVGVEHNKKVIKSNKGRVYMTARVDRNVVRWSDAFLAARKQAKAGERRIPTGLTMGIPPSIDPDELRIQASGNRAEVPKNARYAPILSIPSAQFNGRRMVDAMFRLPGDPTLGK